VLLRVILISILIIYSVTHSFSQVTDSTSYTTTHKSDTLKKKHSPKKAALMSACLPGLGQVYNKKYWKVPVIYVGFAALGYAFYRSQTLYVNYRDAYKYRVDNDPTTIDNYMYVYSDNTLFEIQQHYHRNRDLSAIGLGLVYILNIVDASVDGHLFTFDVSDDLSFNIHPNVVYIASTNKYQSGFTLKINF
jgi:hypothetical protein